MFGDSPRAASLRARPLYTIRFVFAGDLLGEWNNSARLIAHTYHRSIMLHLPMTDAAAYATACANLASLLLRIIVLERPNDADRAKILMRGRVAMLSPD